MASVDDEREYTLQINGVTRSVRVPVEEPLLWVLRDDLGLTGTKPGCNEGECGCCLVLVNGVTRTSCDLPVDEVRDQAVVTIEGVGDENSDRRLVHFVQRAFLAEQASQCGWCLPALVMATIALLLEHPQPTEPQVAEAMDKVYCRCGVYNRIRRAILRAATTADGARSALVALDGEDAP